MFTDTHSHIYLENFDDDIDNVIIKSIENKVNRILLPNIDSSSIDRMLDLSDKYPENCFPMIGLHPTSVDKNWMNEMKIIQDFLEKRDFIGIGEIGIDLYWDTTFKNEQIDAFRYQIELAKKKDLPFVIHARNSFEEIFDVLEQNGDQKYNGIFHAFSGSVEDGKRAVGLGFKLGIGGVITYKNAGLDKIIRELGYHDLVLETDSPYLTPVPFRGKRNESAYIKYIADKLCDIFGIKLAELAKVTENNVNSLFKF